MSHDLPFKAEYAKSGRAGCQLCKTNIAQDSLRIAKMVQSPHFDGKIPRWFHYSCFFKKSRVSNVGDIGGFDSLRWDDQQKIKTVVGGGEVSGGKDETDAGAEKDFQTEYAKSSRSKCRSCQEKIGKGELRIAKMVEPDEKAAYARAGKVPNWYHVPCFLDKREELVLGTLSVADIEGFGTLEKDDQKSLSSKLSLSKKKSKEKRKAKGEQKKEREETEEEKQLRDQNEKLWKLRDGLKKNCSLQEMRQMLEENGQSSSGGEDALLSKCADGMMFGALNLCPACSDGHLFFDSEGYSCKGHVSGWTPCLYTTKTPGRSVWKISSELKEGNDFLKALKCKLRTRVFPKEAPKSSSALKEKEQEKPLEGRSVVVFGKLSKPKNAITKIITELGGTVKAKISSSVYCCISTKAEVESNVTKVTSAKLNGIPIVSEGYLTAVEKGGAALMLKQYSLVPWGPGETSFASGKAEKRPAEKELEEMGPKKAKLKVKGAAAVDPDSGLEERAHVYEANKNVYNAILGLVDLTRGTNSYYKMQVLEADNASRYWIFRAWGRVGTKIGGNKLEDMGKNREAAVNAFLTLFAEKTGNEFSNRTNFVKYPNRFYPLDIDYGQDDVDLKESLKNPTCESKLSESVQSIIRMIFDVESMKNAMIEFEIDLKKMPLGKLSKSQIQKAYAVLTELQTHLSVGASTSKMLDASNRFYTLIPHDFGLKKPPLLDSQEILKGKLEMLDNLLEIEVAYSLLKGSEGGDTKNPIDAHYESLKTELTILDQDSKEFEYIREYVKNTHATTHSSYKLEVLEVFKVARQGEAERYKPFKELHNRKLLWHGSRTTNFAGILSQGLRIAPPEAPATGYMFGKGIYFADMVSKSANYCYASSSNSVGLMLLCEVALGDMYELKQAKSITKLPAGKHSCKGMGKTIPNPEDDVTLPDGTVVPQGTGITTKVKNSSLLYNEYIVYDVAQVNIQYLIKMNFKYSSRW